MLESRDLALTDQADTLLTLEDRIVALTADADAYRLLATTALTELHQLTMLVHRQRETIVTLHELLRDQRAAARERVA